MATGAYPFLGKLKPTTFLRMLSVAEITTGAGLLAPFVPERAAGAALTAFSGGLVTMYLRTPALHRPGSVWPTPGGIAVSKDVWMLGIGASLLLDSIVSVTAEPADVSPRFDSAYDAEDFHLTIVDRIVV